MCWRSLIVLSIFRMYPKIMSSQAEYANDISVSHFTLVWLHPHCAFAWVNGMLPATPNHCAFKNSPSPKYSSIRILTPPIYAMTSPYCDSPHQSPWAAVPQSPPAVCPSTHLSANGVGSVAGAATIFSADNIKPFRSKSMCRYCRRPNARQRSQPHGSDISFSMTRTVSFALAVNSVGMRVR